MKKNVFFAFLLVFGLGASGAYATNGENASAIISETLINSNETGEIKPGQEKYTFTLFSFFTTEVQSKKDTTTTIQESKPVDSPAEIKTDL